MAKIANTAFEARVTDYRTDDLCNVAGKYQESNADAICSAGILCVRASKLPCEGFSGVYNENAWIFNAATADATMDDVIYAQNSYEWQLLPDGARSYAVGHETLSLALPAGRVGNFTRVDFDGQKQYRFGVGNLSAALSTNKYLKLTANGLLLPAASAPTAAGSIYFEVVETGNFVEGNVDSFGYVQVIGHKVSFAA